MPRPTAFAESVLRPDAHLLLHTRTVGNAEEEPRLAAFA